MILRHKGFIRTLLMLFTMVFGTPFILASRHDESPSPMPSKRQDEIGIKKVIRTVSLTDDEQNLKESERLEIARNKLRAAINSNDREDLLVRYLASQHLLNQDIRNSIENKFIQLDADPSKINSTITFINNALSLPNEVKDALRYDSDLVEKLINAYSPSVKEHLHNYCFDLANLNTNNYSGVIFLHGAPGTGKTLAGKLMGEALSLPVAVLSLAGKGVSDLEGKSFEWGHPTPGAFMQSLIDAKRLYGETYKNMILIIDDFDRILNGNDQKSKETLAYMLSLLDPASGRKFQSPYFEAEVELPRHIILTGNSSIKDLAMRLRFNNILVDGFTVENKKKVLWEKNIPSILAKYSSLTVDPLPEVAVNTIDALIEKDRDPGFRTINILIDEYLKEVLRLVHTKAADRLVSLEEKYLERLTAINKETSN